MKCIHKGKVIPDFIVEVDTVTGDDGKKVTRVDLKPDFDYGSRAFLRKCMSERDVVHAPALLEFFNSTKMAMKIWWDGKRWDSGRFTPEEYMDLVRRAEAKHQVIQYGKPKWPTGGGRQASGAGKIFWADKDVTGELYKKYLMVDADHLDARQKVSRTPILFAEYQLFTQEPVIKLLSIEQYGIVWISPEYAMKQGIQRGDKIWPIKASAEIAPFNMSGFDMMIPKDAVKFDDHTNDPTKLSKLMGYIPSLTAKMRSSIEKDRIPKLALDTMQWFHPEIKKFFDEDERVKVSLEKIRKVVEGRATLDEVLELGRYQDPATGEDRWPMEFEFLRRGQSIHTPEIRKAVFKAAGTAALKVMCFRVGGQYGIGMPTSTHATKRRLAVVPPWMLPFWTETDIDGVHTCGIDSDFMVQGIGKDYDGDLVILMKLEWLRKKLGITGDFFPDWTKKRDQEWARKYIALPEKSKTTDKRTVHDVMVDGLKSYGLIGIATNMAMTVIDAMRVSTKANRRDLMGLYLKLMSTEVQQFVDGLKYNPKGFFRPRLESKESRKGFKMVGMAEKYGADEAVALKVRDYFRAVRGMDFEVLAGLPEDDSMKDSFYYTIASLFRGWKPIEAVDMQKLAVKMAELHPLPDSVERARSRSFPRYKNDAMKRFHGEVGLEDGIEHMLTNDEMVIALIARCWVRRDTSLALYIEKWCGKRLIDIAAEEVNVQEGQ